MKLVTLIISLISSVFNKVVTQDFKLEGYEYLFPIPFTSFDIWLKGKRPIIRYCGKEWERNRDEFMIEKHGMTNAEMMKPENAHLFIAKLSLTSS